MLRSVGKPCCPARLPCTAIQAQTGMLQGYNTFTAASNSQFLVPLSPPKSQNAQHYGQQGPPPGSQGWSGGGQQQLPQYWMPHPEGPPHMPHPYGHPGWPQPLQHSNWGPPPPANAPVGTLAHTSAAAGQDNSQPLVGKLSFLLIFLLAGPL